MLEELNNEIAISREFLCEEFKYCFDRVWELCLGEACVEREAPLNESEFTSPWLGSVVWIGGDWTGCIRILVNEALASKIVDCMFQGALEEISRSDAIDALREVANVAAGNFQSIIPGKCGLLTPGDFLVTSYQDIKGECDSVGVFTYTFKGFPFIVTLNSIDTGHGIRTIFS